MNSAEEDKEPETLTANDVTYNASDRDSDEPDPYENLPRGDDTESANFRLNADTNEYHLEEWFTLPAEQYNGLFQHQRTGIAWMYGLFRKKIGGVLGDDMGLGKTVQVASLLQGLFRAEKIKKVLIVVPTTLK